MLSICFSTKDKRRVSGIHHFIEKYGLSIELNPRRKTRICIAYGSADAKGDFIIRVPENDFSSKFEGWISSKNLRAPIFEMPSEVSGDSMADFVSETIFPCISKSEKQISFGFDLFNSVGQVLSGAFEPILHSLSSKDKKSISKVPFLDIYEEFLFKAILLNNPFLQ